MPTSTYQAIVLRTTPYREADIIGTMISDSAGLVNFIARHAKRTTKRHGCSIEILDCADFECIPPKKPEGLAEVVSVSNRIIWHGMHNSPAVFCAACFLAELGNIFCKTHEDAKAFFTLLRESLNQLNICTSRDDILEVLVATIISALNLAGLNPAENIAFSARVSNRLNMNKRESQEFAEDLIQYIENYSGFPLRTRAAISNFISKNDR